MASLASVSPLVARARFGDQALHGQFDVLRDSRQEAALVPCDCVASHAELVSEFLLSETEEEPLTSKLPTGQVEGRLPEGAYGVNAL